MFWVKGRFARIANFREYGQKQLIISFGFNRQETKH